MKKPLLCMCLLTAIGLAAFTSPLAAQTESGEKSKPRDNADAQRDKKSDDREAKFKKLLTDVVFRGTWSMTNEEGLSGKAPLTTPRPERYVIKSVSKGVDDNWVITAKIQYADKDVLVPVNVRVVWAGDTPVITLDKMQIPLLGTYSARVVIHEGFYAGTWHGIGYGGVLSGQIIRPEDEKKLEEMDKAGFTPGMPKSKAAPAPQLFVPNLKRFVIPRHHSPAPSEPVIRMGDFPPWYPVPNNLPRLDGHDHLNPY